MPREAATIRYLHVGRRLDATNSRDCRAIGADA
jgi:hypothetical protein